MTQQNNDPVIAELAELKGDIKELAKSMNECVLAITRKETSDHFLAESLKEEKLKNIEQDKRLLNLEIAGSGDNAIRRIFWIAVTVITGALVSAVFYSVVAK